MVIRIRCTQSQTRVRCYPRPCRPFLFSPSACLPTYESPDSKQENGQAHVTSDSRTCTCMLNLAHVFALKRVRTRP
eukprot:5075440-Pleurochrysis_carterae.AAC.1